MKCSDLRHRKWHTIAFCGATGDMKQGAYATQHFVSKENEWWNEQYVETKKEPITQSYTHSDNAYHFKSAKCMNFLSRVPLLFSFFKVVAWCFGCAGHGKGVSDGIGGMLKRILRQDTIDGSILSSSGDLVDCLCCKGWRASVRQRHSPETSRYTFSHFGPSQHSLRLLRETSLG